MKKAKKEHLSNIRLDRTIKVNNSSYPITFEICLTDAESQTETAKIRILSGEYKGLTYRYGKVKFIDDTKSKGTFNIQFDYHIDENPNNVEESKTLINIMGEILSEIITLQVNYLDGSIHKN